MLLAPEAIFFNTLAFAERAMTVGTRRRPVGRPADEVQDGGGSHQVTSPSLKGPFYMAGYKVVLMTARPSQKHSTLERIDQLSRHEITCKYAAALCYSFFFYLTERFSM